MTKLLWILLFIEISILATLFLGILIGKLIIYFSRLMEEKEEILHTGGLLLINKN